MSEGKLIVLEGTDGSGKGTQLMLLDAYLKSHHIVYRTLDFPQYYKTFFGRWVGRFLKGEFGDPANLPPHILSIPYAADRWQAKEELVRWIAEGKIVLVNRYVGSNAVYQSARLPIAKRRQFVDWVMQMEYQEFGIPKEDLVIFLYVPLAVSQKLIEKKANRKYLGGRRNKDVNEANIAYMEQVERVYLEFAGRYPHWTTIECTHGGAMLTKEEIHQKLVEVLKKKHVLR